MFYIHIIFKKSTNYINCDYNFKLIFLLHNCHFFHFKFLNFSNDIKKIPEIFCYSRVQKYDNFKITLHVQKKKKEK